MRRYLELIEVSPEGVAEEPDFIRVDVTDWRPIDVEEALRLLKEHAEVYDSYVIQFHDCYHEEGQLCTLMVVESRARG